MARQHRDHFAGIWCAQEARKREGWTTDCAATAAAVNTTNGERRSISGLEPGPGNSGCKTRQAGETAAIPLERDVLRAVLAALRAHPLVAFVERMNSGAYKSQAGHYVRFGFVGCPDVIGMLKDGRFLACEVKRPGGNPTSDQVEFLGCVARWHGVAFVAWSADDVGRALA